MKKYLVVLGVSILCALFSYVLITSISKEAHAEQSRVPVYTPVVIETDEGLLWVVRGNKVYRCRSRSSKAAPDCSLPHVLR